MSDTTKNPRIVLGPVARKLIEGKGDKQQQALDDAILALQETPENAGQPVPDTTALEKQIGSLEAHIERQAEAIRQLSYATTLQHKMTRILIASVMSTTNEEQQTLLALADQTAEDAHAKTELIGESEIEMLEREEAAMTTAINREFERVGIEPEAALEEELER